jgi:hypothetical protein
MRSVIYRTVLRRLRFACTADVLEEIPRAVNGTQQRPVRGSLFDRRVVFNSEGRFPQEKSMFTHRFMETFESRTLLTTTPSPLTTAVSQDHDQIRADLLKFRSDMLSGFATFQADVVAIKNDGVKDATTLTPLIVQFVKDLHKMRRTLKGDLLKEGDAVGNDEHAIFNDMRHITRDKHHDDHEANKSDHSDLLANRIQLQNDMIASLNARIQVRQTDFATLQADMTAIVSAAQTDPHASAQLVTDLQKAQTDETNRETTLTTDLQTLVADRTQLVADLTAMQSTAG